MAIGEKESKQIKQNTSRDGGVRVCMGVVSGLRAKGCALIQAEGGWGG